MSWEFVNRKLIAKAIRELYFEEVITTEVKVIENNFYMLELSESAIYSFSAFKSIWCDLVIDAGSLKRNDGKTLDAAVFFKETQCLTKMGDITLSHFLEEMLNTLYSDQVLLRKSLPVEKMFKLNTLDLEAHLNGHPKLILNKGRVGWSPDDLSAYSPEKGGVVKFVRVAVKKDLLIVNSHKNRSFDEIVLADLSEFDIRNFEKALSNKNIDSELYYIVPAHPWQWENKIKVFFQEDISKNNIILLSSTGDYYKPHISIRTFSNCTNHVLCDVKLPISILNTSCIRGIPANYISVASEISDGVDSILKQDLVFIEAGTDCLKDIAAFSYIAPSYRDLFGAPYRYKEFFGAIWRESCDAKLNLDEKCMMTGALSHLDENGKSFIGFLIEESSLPIEQWLERYFCKVVIPLYHLQSQYGIGLVAHGQNTLLKLSKNIPSGLIIKDFQGDLRLNENLPIETKKLFSNEVIDRLDVLPAEHIIYDLITGHFVSVLRFISQALFISHGYKEEDFYHILGTVIFNYEKEYSTKSKTPSLLSSSYHRVLLNKARFEIGYQDSSQRPKPLLGNPLLNPLTVKGCVHGKCI